MSAGLFGTGSSDLIEEVTQYITTETERLRTSASEIAASLETTKNTLDGNVTVLNSQLESNIQQMRDLIAQTEVSKNTLISAVNSALSKGTDTTLSLNGIPADAKAVGTRIAELLTDINSIKDYFAGTVFQTKLKKSITAMEISKTFHKVDFEVGKTYKIELVLNKFVSAAGSFGIILFQSTNNQESGIVSHAGIVHYTDNNVLKAGSILSTYFKPTAPGDYLYVQMHAWPTGYDVDVKVSSWNMIQ